MSQTKTDMAKSCDYCGRTGAMKSRVTAGKGGKQIRLFCHTVERSCFNACRGRYFEPCRCNRVYDKPYTEEYERWTLLRHNPECRLHPTPEPV